MPAEAQGARGVRHVLVVEDDSPIRALLADLLDDAGYAVLQAGDGFEALQQLHQTRPDLIVLDLMLPGGAHEGARRTRGCPDLKAIPATPALVALLGPSDRGDAGRRGDRASVRLARARRATALPLDTLPRRADIRPRAPAASGPAERPGRSRRLRVAVFKLRYLAARYASPEIAVVAPVDERPQPPAQRAY